MDIDFRTQLPFEREKLNQFVESGAFAAINSYNAGTTNVNFRKISVRKMIWDLEFSEHLL